MCRLRENELYRLKFRKKFVKNGQEEMSSVREVSTLENWVREGKGEERGVCGARGPGARVSVSRRLQTTLYICRHREICLMTEHREKRSVASPCIPRYTR